MVDKQKAKEIGFAGALVLIGWTKIGKGVIGEGQIVASEPAVYGYCRSGQCVAGEMAFIYITYTNVGSLYTEKLLGIKINDMLVKSEKIGLGPGKEVTLSYELPIGNMSYSICGTVT
jgi:hypothetical protein